MSENKVSFSVPELTPVFSYATVYGVISVYLFKTLNTNNSSYDSERRGI
jgi:hypothetical protein